jgi:hypothetical protein
MIWAEIVNHSRTHMTAIFNERGGKTLLTVHLAVWLQAGWSRFCLNHRPAHRLGKARGETPGPVVVKVPGSSWIVRWPAPRLTASTSSDRSPPGVTPMAARIVSADLVLVPVRAWDDMDADASHGKLSAKPYVFVQSDCPQRAYWKLKSGARNWRHKRPIFGPVHNWHSSGGAAPKLAAGRLSLTARSRDSILHFDIIQKEQSNPA